MDRQRRQRQFGQLQVRRSVECDEECRPDASARISLISRRLVLRAYRLADAQAVWEAIDESRPSLERWVPDIGRRQTPDDVRCGLGPLVTSPGERLVFVVCERTTGRILGEVGLYDVDWQNGLGEVGFWLRQTARRRGYMAEALQVLTDHATRGLGLRRLEAHIAPENTESARVVEKQGYRIDRPRAATPERDGDTSSILIYALETVPSWDGRIRIPARITPSKSDAEPSCQGIVRVVPTQFETPVERGLSSPPSMVPWYRGPSNTRD
jgi:RimJ/RimL family protein N-acetyltransferase